MSEFPCYDFDTASKLSRARLHLIHAEALRQRASKAYLLASLINKPNQEEATQRKLNESIESMLNPHKAFYENVIEDSWESLRRRRKT